MTEKTYMERIEDMEIRMKIFDNYVKSKNKISYQSLDDYKQIEKRKTRPFYTRELIKIDKLKDNWKNGHLIDQNLIYFFAYKSELYKKYYDEIRSYIIDNGSTKNNLLIVKEMWDKLDGDTQYHILEYEYIIRSNIINANP